SLATSAASGREPSPRLRYLDDLNSDGLGLEFWLAFFEQHFQNFSKVLPQLVQGRPLTMGARPAGHVADVQLGVRIPLHNDVRGAHMASLTTTYYPDAPASPRSSVAQGMGSWSR